MSKHIFSNLSYSEEWNGRYCETTLSFGGEERSVGLLVQGDEDEKIAGIQRKAYDAFIGKWQTMEGEMLESLLNYYNEEEKFAYGPDDPEESAEWWPDIDTPEAMAKAVTPEILVIPEEFMMEEGRRVYLLCSRVWGGEDLDDNGVAVAFLNEEVVEIGYKDIAF